MRDAEHDEERTPTGHELLRRSGIEHERKFWSGERSFSILEWSFLLLMLIPALLLLAVWIRNRYLIGLAVLGGLAAFVIIGNLRARRKPK
jgi:hypothetical protein